MEMKGKVKRSILGKLKEMMKEDDSHEMDEKLGSKLKGMKVVKVMAKDKEGLEQGLSMAQKILKKKKEMMKDDD